MRTALLVAAALSLTALAPLASALLPGACTSGSATTAVNFAWSPACVSVASGGLVTFGNADTATHNARSAGDDNAVARLVGPRCFETPNMGQGGSFQVRFTHTADGLSAALRNANGSFGPENDCTLAEDATTMLTGGEAAIGFECGIHQTMTGSIRVALG